MEIAEKMVQPCVMTEWASNVVYGNPLTDDEKEIREYPLDQLRFKKRHGRNKKNDVSEKELKELEKLEKQDEKSKL